MEQIRYTQRICNDPVRIERFLTDRRVGTLSMADPAGRPYAVPVNYLYWNGRIYFHGLGSGKKNDLLAANPAVCFSVFEEFGTVADAAPCKCDTSYFSVVLFGRALPVAEREEKAEALTRLLEKFTPQLFKNPLAPELVAKYRSSLDNRAVAVYRIVPEALTAKENPPDPEHMFQARPKGVD